MPIISVESAVVSVSSRKKGFNGDSFNQGGKIASIESLNSAKGRKVAATLHPGDFCAISSSNQPAFAAGAMTALNENKSKFSPDREKNLDVLYEFLEDMDAVVKQCPSPDASISSACVYIRENGIDACVSGGCRILRFSVEKGLFEIAHPDIRTKKGFQSVNDFSDGDYIILLGAECSDDPSYNRLDEILSDGVNEDVKQVIQEIYRTVSDRHEYSDKTVMLIKFHDDAPKEIKKSIPEAAAAVPIYSAKSEAKSSLPQRSNAQDKVIDDDSSVSDERNDYSDRNEKQDDKILMSNDLGTTTAKIKINYDGDFTSLPAVHEQELSEDELSIEKEDEDNGASEKVSAPKPITAKRRFKNSIPIIIVIILVAVAFGTYVATHYDLFNINTYAGGEPITDKEALSEENEKDLNNMVNVDEASMNDIEDSSDRRRTYISGGSNSGDNSGDSYDSNDYNNNADSDNGGNENNYVAPTTQARTTAAYVETTTQPTTQPTTQAQQNEDGGGDGGNDQPNGGDDVNEVYE